MGLDTKQKPDYFISYYLVAFIDLLGQQEAMQKFSGLPALDDKEQMEKFRLAVKDTFGVIDKFHDSFKNYFNSYSKREGKSLNLLLDQTSNNIKFQRFSDGLVIFVSLRDDADKTPIGNVYGVLAACASMFLLWLSINQPLRGGIEVGLGSEVNENEIYGPAVSEAYNLETKVAQYPRVVVGKELINYLRLSQSSSKADIHSKISKETAKLCLDMLAIDVDGYPIVDYLGRGFKNSVAKNLIDDVPSNAYKFILEQCEKWRTQKNTKLAFRYALLKDYFDARLTLWQK